MVKAFGGHESYFKEIEVVQLRNMTYRGAAVYIEALVVLVVCSPLPNQRPKTAKLQYPHLRNLYLSDFTDDPDMDIDILVESDFYWSFMTGRVVLSENVKEPVALETSIGWVLSGNHVTPHKKIRMG